MANELTISTGMILNKSGFPEVRVEEGGHQITISSGRSYRGQQSVGLVEEAILLGDMTPGSLRWLYMKNLATTGTDYVLVRAAAGAQAFAKLNPGETMLIPTGSAAYYAIAVGTGAVNVEVAILEA